MYELNFKNPLNISSAQDKSNGFTLIELLIAIVIMAGIFSFSFSSFRNFGKQQSLKGAVREFKADMRFAQEQALAGKKPDGGHCAAVDSVLKGYRVAVVNSAALHQYTITAVCSDGDDLVSTKDLWDKYTDITFVAVVNTTFLNLGKGALPPATDFVLTDGTTTTTIQVTRTGKIY